MYLIIEFKDHFKILDRLLRSLKETNTFQFNFLFLDIQTAHIAFKVPFVNYCTELVIGSSNMSVTCGTRRVQAGGWSDACHPSPSTCRCLFSARSSASKRRGRHRHSALPQTGTSWTTSANEVGTFFLFPLIIFVEIQSQNWKFNRLTFTKFPRRLYF